MEKFSIPFGTLLFGRLYRCPVFCSVYCNFLISKKHHFSGTEQLTDQQQVDAGKHSPSSSDSSMLDNVKAEMASATNTPDSPERNHLCRFCNKPFENREQLNIHYTHTHRDKPQYECEVCFKVRNVLDVFIVFFDSFAIWLSITCTTVEEVNGEVERLSFLMHFQQFLFLILDSFHTLFVFFELVPPILHVMVLY